MIRLDENYGYQKDLRSFCDILVVFGSTYPVMWHFLFSLNMQPVPQRYLEGCLSDDILPLDPHGLIHSHLPTDSTLNSQAKHIS